MEKYSGVKFKVIEENIPISRRESSLLLLIDKKIGKILKTKENEGNVSIKTKNGFLIKRTGAKLGKLTKKDVVLVRKITGNRVHCSGGVPSSESRMHKAIYENAADANIILHFHFDELLGKTEARSIGPFAYGTAELANSAGKITKNNRFFEIKGHGFVISGKNQSEIFKLLKINILKNKNRMEKK